MSDDVTDRSMTVLLGGPHDGMEIDPRGCNMIEIPEINPDLTGPPWRRQMYRADGTYVGVVTPGA